MQDYQVYLQMHLLATNLKETNYLMVAMWLGLFLFFLFAVKAKLQAFICTKIFFSSTKISGVMVKKVIFQENFDLKCLEQQYIRGASQFLPAKSKNLILLSQMRYKKTISTKRFTKVNIYLYKEVIDVSLKIKALMVIKVNFTVCKLTL